ncbi:MAG: two-component regulator propeller domain-containing protein [Candidatus Accumulibacter phosphatis]|uniref:ligand-binding sensor domain-containing protein n=1 Tax=Candidatus Accumulibacter contiguus TaxID=2954381 RepID=UPI002FC3D600
MSPCWTGSYASSAPCTPAPARATPEASGQPLPPARIEAMAQARDGTLWLGTDSALYQFTRDHRQLRVLPHAGGLTRQLLASTDGSLWVGTQDGVFRLRPGTAAIVRVAQHAGQSLRADINALAEASDGSVWVGSGKGLFRAAAGEHELRSVACAEGAGLGNPSVIGLLFDRQQTLWVDTAVTGLHRMRHWDGQHAAFERISERHGIVTRPFGGNLLEDGRGRIWTQIYVYDPATDRLDELTAADGADLGTGWFLAHTRTTDGRLLFGGSRGILVVRPEGFDASDYAPPLVVSEFAIDGQRQPVGHIQEGFELVPPQRGFSLVFAALDYSDSGRLRYAYQLQGFDTDWIATTADSRVASYRCSMPSRQPAAMAGWERSTPMANRPKRSSTGRAGRSPTGRAQATWRSSARRFHERPATGRRAAARASMRSVPLGPRARSRLSRKEIPSILHSLRNLE